MTEIFFCLLLDYPNGQSYWLQQSPLDTSLDQAGIVLGRAKGIVTISGIARRNGGETAAGVAIGDRLLKIDALDVSGASHGQLLAALHGKPGEKRHLVLERGGKQVEVDVAVTAF